MSAIIFPGQGSQYTNMAIDFNDNFQAARNTFQEIEDSTKINIRKIIIENQQDKLNQTKYTQISIFAASMAIYSSILSQFDKVEIYPKIVLGHSLGEYSALVANKMLSISNASKLIKIRGELMQSAIEPNSSGMAAIIGKNSSEIEKIINKHNLEIVVANDNSPLQVVISGLIKDIDFAQSIFISNGVKRYIKLNVSAAFHSKYMKKAQEKLISEIDKIPFNFSSIPIISNYDANINNDIDKVIVSLKYQMANKVKWTESILKLEHTDIKNIIEIGPSKVLSGLVSRISNKFDIISIDKLSDLEKFN